MWDVGSPRRDIGIRRKEKQGPEDLDKNKQSRETIKPSNWKLPPRSYQSNQNHEQKYKCGVKARDQPCYLFRWCWECEAEAGKMYAPKHSCRPEPYFHAQQEHPIRATSDQHQRADVVDWSAVPGLVGFQVFLGQEPFPHETVTAKPHFALCLPQQCQHGWWDFVLVFQNGDGRLDKLRLLPVQSVDYYPADGKCYHRKLQEGDGQLSGCACDYLRNGPDDLCDGQGLQDRVGFGAVVDLFLCQVGEKSDMAVATKSDKIARD